MLNLILLKNKYAKNKNTNKSTTLIFLSVIIKLIPATINGKKKVNIAAGKTVRLEMNSLAECTWKSSNETVATVNSNGVVKGIKNGEVKITTELYGKIYTCVVTVD